MSGDGGRQIPAPVVATAEGWKSLQQAPLRPIRKLPEMAPRTAADLPTCSPRLQRVSRTHYATHTQRVADPTRLLTLTIRFTCANVELAAPPCGRANCSLGNLSSP